MHVLTNECTGLLHIAIGKLGRKNLPVLLRGKTGLDKVRMLPTYLSLRIFKLCIEIFPQQLYVRLFIRYPGLLPTSASSFRTWSSKCPARERRCPLRRFKWGSGCCKSAENPSWTGLQCAGKPSLSLDSKLYPHNRDRGGNIIYLKPSKEIVGSASLNQL